MREQEILEIQQNLDVGKWVSIIESRWKQVPEFKVDPERLKHLAIICDGNRRSAQEKGLHPWQGHRLGVEVIKGIMRVSNEWGIRHLTFWTWSTENWERDKEQVNFVMGLAARYLRDEDSVNIFLEHEARFTHLGRKDRLPESVRTAIEELERRTAEFSQHYVNLALDYGGLDEMARTVVKIIEEVKSGRLSTDQILKRPEMISQHMDTVGQPFPDLVIRTGAKPGEIPHTSGFLPLQTSYAGWSFLPDLFPDVTPENLLVSIQEFIEYERRFGR